MEDSGIVGEGRYPVTRHSFLPVCSNAVLSTLFTEILEFLYMGDEKKSHGTRGDICRIVVLSCCQIIVLSNCRIVELSYCRIVELSYYRIVRGDNTIMREIGTMALLSHHTALPDNM